GPQQQAPPEAAAKLAVVTTRSPSTRGPDRAAVRPAGRSGGGGARTGGTAKAKPSPRLRWPQASNSSTAATAATSFLATGSATGTPTFSSRGLHRIRGEWSRR
ncbi:unnamed protein product, partial [Ectocarpus sp. 13 AM-2016]